MRVGILGGTGPAGRGVGIRAALAGHEVMLGSRNEAKAAEAARGLGHERIKGSDNHEAAAFGDVVVLSVPWEAAMQTAVEVEREARGKVLMSMANAVAFIDGKPEPVVPSSGSIALGIQARLPTVRVAASMHHVPARSLYETDVKLDFDVLTCSDDKGALDRVTELVRSIDGLRPIDAGGLHNASAIEALTPLLIALNSRYKARTGIRIIGID
ncbi:MAG: NADPH-dependent F420 reductase [Actinobacteria bacterium ATB1]|nr:NADPH-dependent F420 reductase [Actinobacteria bacterium ATB1]